MDPKSKALFLGEKTAEVVHPSLAPITAFARLANVMRQQDRHTYRVAAGSRWQVERSHGWLDESMAISSELGMGPLMERVATLQERAESLSVRVPAYPDGLTAREVEVLRMVAAGKTDKAIADELFIGVRTVSFHVGNILDKTGSANRTEAASYANQRGLL